MLALILWSFPIKRKGHKTAQPEAQVLRPTAGRGLMSALILWYFLIKEKVRIITSRRFQKAQIPYLRPHTPAGKNMLPIASWHKTKKADLVVLPNPLINERLYESLTGLIRSLSLSSMVQ